MYVVTVAVDFSLLSLLPVDPLHAFGEDSSVSGCFTVVRVPLVLLISALVQILVKEGPVADDDLGRVLVGHHDRGLC